MARSTLINATFACTKDVRAALGLTERGKGLTIMGIAARHLLPLAVSTFAANHQEVPLVPLSFFFYLIKAKMENIGDRACDSDKVDDEMK